MCIITVALIEWCAQFRTTCECAMPRVTLPLEGLPYLPLMSLMQEGATALHMASQEGHNDTVQLLLDSGASVDKPTKV